MRDIFRKPRSESEKLLIFRSLNFRGKLTEKEKRYYWNLEKGFAGELMLDERVRKLSNDFIVLCDLTFEFSNNEFQIDSLIISQKRIYILDSKNNEGDFYYDKNRFYRKDGSEVQDPLPQLRKCDSLFRRMLKYLGYDYTVESYIIFINPEFYLYRAPLDEPFVFPTQLNRFFSQLDAMQSKLNKYHYQLAEKLMEICLEKSSNEKIPTYQFGDLKKGLSCASCHSLHVDCEGSTVVCQNCGFKEKLKAAVLRSVGEIKMLFPDMKITTNLVHGWCEGCCSKKTIQRILSSNFIKLGNGVSSYYIIKKVK